MKKVYLLIVLFSFGVSHSQKSIDFVKTDFNETLKLAKKSNKIAVYIFYANWCPHCEKMRKYVFTEPDVAEFFNSKFVTNIQDAESSEGMPLAKKFAVKAYPTFIFLDDNGTVLYQMSGELNSEKLIVEAKNAMDRTKQFPYLKSEFAKDVSNGDNALAYISVLRKAGLDASNTANQYFQTVKRDDIFTAMNWKIFANGVSDMDTEIFQFVVKNQPGFAMVSSEKRVSRKLVNAASERLEAYVGQADTINYNAKRKAVANLNLAKTDSLLFLYDRRIAERANDWKKYHKASAAGIKNAWNDPTMLTEIVRNDLKNLTDNTLLLKDIEWINRAIELKPDQEKYLALAKLQFKTGQKNLSLKSAQMARDLAASYQFSTTEIDAFIKEIK